MNQGTFIGTIFMILHILIQIGLIVRVLLRPLKGRIDLRNHRKIVVIDYQITYCGSQNCAPGISGQGEVCTVGGCHDALQGADRPPEPIPVR